MKHKLQVVGLESTTPAAFRRLCVETTAIPVRLPSASPAAFRRLCVETSAYAATGTKKATQPPSGGCVLKPRYIIQNPIYRDPAAFRRLCVETISSLTAGVMLPSPAAFRRLCVETSIDTGSLNGIEPAAFRRLCVETVASRRWCESGSTSRLQAAVC